MKLQDKVAVITGAGRGIGKAIALACAREGAKVAICARTGSEVEQTAKEIRLIKTEAEGWVCDVSVEQSVKEFINNVIEKFGRIDILINNAGTNIPQPIDQIKDEDWDRVLEINLNSIMVLTRAIVPQMKARKWGRIIHISSIMGLVSKGGRDAYSVTKSALIGLARASAIDLGPFGITVNCIAPGPFLTDLPGRLLSQAEKDAFAKMTVLNRWGEPSELVGPALMLASDAGSYVTGETIASAVEEQSITTKEITRNFAETSVAVESVASGAGESSTASRDISQSIAHVHMACQETAQCAAQTQTAGKELFELADRAGFRAFVPARVAAASGITVQAVLRDQRRDVGARLLDRHARLQPRKHLDVAQVLFRV